MKDLRGNGMQFHKYEGVLNRTHNKFPFPSWEEMQFPQLSFLSSYATITIWKLSHIFSPFLSFSTLTISFPTKFKDDIQIQQKKVKKHSLLFLSIPSQNFLSFPQVILRCHKTLKWDHFTVTIWQDKEDMFIIHVDQV